jgi:PncC family amidohydrolase
MSSPVVAYSADVKAQILGVDDQLIASHGTIDGEVARQMAEGTRLRLGATWGIGTTGNAGPDSSEGKPVGEVHIAVAGPGTSSVRELMLSGDRDAIRRTTASAALSLLLATLEEQSVEPIG